MPYAIYPPLGFARLGNSDEFFVGPEESGAVGVELTPTGEQPVTAFKDAHFKMKRQGARFRLIEVDAHGHPVSDRLPSGAIVRWAVTMANRKDAIRRPASPPSIPRRVQDDPARQDRLIEASGQLSGGDHSPVALVGTYVGQPITLGHMLTDSTQRLIVLAGRGRSGTFAVPPAPIGGSFYNNRDWFDDVGDGPVTATVQIPGEAQVAAEPAWVITAPPDFAPTSLGVVTLYDMLRQVAIENGWLAEPPRPSFEADIKPMIERASDLRLVDRNPTWPRVSRDWGALSDADTAHRPLRAQTAAYVREVENALSDFTITDWQSRALDAWVSGNFEVPPRPDRGLADALTRGALDGTVGQGFFPGIEWGINAVDPNIYQTAPFEFRLKPGSLRPGDATAHMAQPWQADFLKCSDGWWPAQRPDRLPTQGGGTVDWLRPPMTHSQLVQNVMRLGVATPGSSGVFEQGRDPSL